MSRNQFTNSQSSWQSFFFFFTKIPDCKNWRFIIIQPKVVFPLDNIRTHLTHSLHKDSLVCVCVCVLMSRNFILLFLILSWNTCIDHCICLYTRHLKLWISPAVVLTVQNLFVRGCSWAVTSPSWISRPSMSLQYIHTFLCRGLICYICEVFAAVTLYSCVL